MTYFSVRFHSYIRKIVEEGITAKEFLPVNPGYTFWIIRGVVQLGIEDQLKYDTARIAGDGLQKIIDLILDKFLRPFPKWRDKTPRIEVKETE